MKDWVNDMLYTSWCRVALRRKIQESVKGNVSVEIVNDDALVQIFSVDYSHKYFAQVVYDFGLRMERHEITELDIDNISGQIIDRFKTKILKKYFK